MTDTKPDKPVPIEGPKLAVDIAKQLITISLALLAFSVAFSNAFRSAPTAPLPIPASLKLAWGLYLGTIFFALWVMFAATGTALNADEMKPSKTGHKNIKLPSGLSIICFFVAIVLTAHAGYAILNP